jgi:hypothetical protein
MIDDPKAQWAHSKALEIRLSFRGKTDGSQFFHTFPLLKGGSPINATGTGHVIFYVTKGLGTGRLYPFWEARISR